MHQRTLLIMFVFIAGVVSACGSFSSAPPVEVILPTTLTLYYNDASLIIHNTGQNPMTGLGRLPFVRAGTTDTADDYSPTRMTSGALGVGGCYTLVRRGNQELTTPNCASGTAGLEQVADITSIFWRAEPVAATEFSIYWDGIPFHNCPTVSVANPALQICTFNYPPTQE